MTTLNFESANGCGGGSSGDGQLLLDIEEISKALYLDQPVQNSVISLPNHKPELTQKIHLPASNSKLSSRFVDGSDGDEGLIRQKKSSVWKWKPLKAISHIWQKKFHCCFFCHVHCIENLPLVFDDLEMSVHWKRKDSVLKTLASRVSNGMVEFEETLMDRCLIYCSRNGPENFVKYDSKHFLLSETIVGAPGLDIGRHWIDLTRLLPLTFEELEDKSPGKWTTSFKLGGKAKGATLHVSFDFRVMTDNMVELGGGRVKLPLMCNWKHDGLGCMNHFASFGYETRNNSMLRRVGSVPSSLHHRPSHSSYCSDGKIVHQIRPNPGSGFSDSVHFLYKKPDEGNLGASEKFDFVFKNSESLKSMPKSFSSDGMYIPRYECNDIEFTITEKGIELDLPKEEQLKLEEPVAGNSNDFTVEVIDVSEIFKDADRVSEEKITLGLENGGSGGSSNNAALDMDPRVCEMEFNNKELDMDLCGIFSSESLPSELLEVENRFLEEETTEGNSKPSKLVESLSLDAITKAVADDFLKLLGEKTSPSASSPRTGGESPRERLLREFEQDMLASGNFLFHSDENEEAAEMSCLNSSFSCSKLAIEDIARLPPIHASNEDVARNKSKKNRTRPKTLECLETRSLMQRWGLDEEAFKSNSHYSTGGFGSPIYLLPVEVGLPPLGEGLGPLLHLKYGGLLRSMSHSLFHAPKNGGSLIIQTSRPIVLPTKMGSDVMEVLQFFASMGLEGLSKKVSDLMPLEEISGKSVQQLPWEASSPEDEPEKSDYLQQKACVKFEGCEALTDNGLSSGAMDESPRSVYIAIRNLVPLLMDRIEGLSIEGLRIQSGMSSLVAPSSIDLRKRSLPMVDVIAQPSTVANSGENVKESLMGLSISLDEWLRLDSRMFPNNDQTSEHMSRLLAGHGANLLGRDNCRENGLLRCGLLGDSPIMAFMIQLRDPIRNFEPVGAPMLSLIEVNRTIDHPSPGIASEKCAGIISTEEGIGEREIHDREGICKFVMKQAHVAGLITDLDGQEIWATRRHKQAGTRWLLANNMNKTNKPHLSKSNAITRFSPSLRKQHSAHTLWSISHKSEGSGHHWGEFPAQNGYLRNPDILFW